MTNESIEEEKMILNEINLLSREKDVDDKFKDDLINYKKLVIYKYIARMSCKGLNKRYNYSRWYIIKIMEKEFNNSK